MGMGGMIDSHDFVVRCTSWVTAHRGQSGAKISAWAWFGSPALWPKVYAIPEGRWESWFVLVPSGKTFNVSASYFAKGVATAHGPNYEIDPALWNLAKSVLRVQPSTGFLAVLMALQRLHPSRLTIVGMDCTLPTNPYWDEPFRVKNWPTDGKRAFGHNYVREKQLLAGSVKNKRFGPMFWETEIDWIGRPAL
jgi:hypothetical protein